MPVIVIVNFNAIILRTWHALARPKRKMIHHQMNNQVHIIFVSKNKEIVRHHQVGTIKYIMVIIITKNLRQNLVLNVKVAVQLIPSVPMQVVRYALLGPSKIPIKL